MEEDFGTETGEDCLREHYARTDARVRGVFVARKHQDAAFLVKSMTKDLLRTGTHRGELGRVFDGLASAVRRGHIRDCVSFLSIAFEIKGIDSMRSDRAVGEISERLRAEDSETSRTLGEQMQALLPFMERIENRAERAGADWIERVDIHRELSGLRKTYARRLAEVTPPVPSRSR